MDKHYICIITLGYDGWGQWLEFISSASYAELRSADVPKFGKINVEANPWWRTDLIMSLALPNVR